MDFRKGLKYGLSLGGAFAPPLKTTFTPFWRWFTNERAKDLQETRELFDRVSLLYARSPHTGDQYVAGIFSTIVEQLRHPILDDAIDECVKKLLLAEPVFYKPEWRDNLSLSDEVAFKKLLRLQENYLQSSGLWTATFVDAIVDTLSGVREMLPDLPWAKEPSLFNGPLYSFFPNPLLAINGIINAFNHEDELKMGMFLDLQETFYRNLCHFNKHIPYTPLKKPLLMPSDSNLTPAEGVEAFLSGTPFYDFFHTSLPIRVPQETFFSHLWCVGGSGAGKTQFLSTLLLHHINSPDKPSVVLVDSHGDLISKVSRLDAIKERLILIDPKDIRHPPAVNIFDVGERYQNYDDVDKEQVVAGAIETLSYLFAHVLGSDLTTKQGAMFRFVMRLLITLPDTIGRHATLIDMLDLFEDHRPFLPAIENLPPIARRFFEKDFVDPKQFGPTKQQVRYRLNAILENPTLERMFTAPTTKLDLFKELNSGSIILIDTSQEFLKDASPTYGRIWLSLILQAIFERAAIPENERHATFLLVDECASYFDQNIDTILTSLRKYRCGAAFFHQYIGQTKENLRQSLASNTAIKMAARVSAHDARALAADMRCDTQFILGQPPLHFAAFISGVTSSAISAPVSVGKLEGERRMDDVTYHAFRDLNRQRLAITEKPGVPPPPNPDAPPAPKIPDPPDDGLTVDTTPRPW